MIGLLALSLMATEADLAAGQKLRREGELERAVAFFQAKVAEAPDQWAARRELGHSLALAGRYREAIEAYQGAPAADPRAQQESARWTGLTLLYLGEVDSALERLKHEAEIAERNGDRSAQVHATWYRGHVLTEVGSFGPAGTAFLEALALEPEDLNTLHLFGVLTARQGDLGSLRYQIEDLRPLAQSAEGRAGGRGQMRRVAHLQGEYELLRGKPAASLPFLERAASLFPHPLYREAIARAQAAQKRLEAAAGTYRSILNATDERLDIPLYYVKALRGLAKTLDALDKREEAAAAYERFLAHWGESSSLPGVAEARERLQSLRAGGSDALP
jgi:tetratricopeptide (TPR) repeat protein